MSTYPSAILNTRPIIAIDGYSSCGKSTLAKAVARELDFLYVDSGAMYRAVTLYFIQNNLEVPDKHDYDENEIRLILDEIHITFKLNPETKLFDIYLNDVNVEKQIRSMNVSDEVSSISTIKEVRNRMVELQRNLGRGGGVVMDGRDIGTAVFPNADLKIFMTADPLVRSQRRFAELQASGIKVTLEEVLKNLQLRDNIDTTREMSPLRKAEDAIVLDNTHLTREQQLDFIIAEVEKLKIVSR
ncbi:MAG: (d)CMP kinase [Bacteroidia bacterium]